MLTHPNQLEKDRGTIRLLLCHVVKKAIIRRRPLLGLRSTVIEQSEIDAHHGQGEDGRHTTRYSQVGVQDVLREHSADRQVNGEPAHGLRDDSGNGSQGCDPERSVRIAIPTPLRRTRSTH